MKFITIGELLMRLSPPDYEKIRTTSSYVVNFGGAEANVAVSLANLGVDTTVFTVLPDNDIGRSAVRSLKANDVHTSPIIFGGERMGVYFLEEGIGVRSSKVIYDRKHSAFAEYDYTTVDFKALLEGYDWLHLSGITPALSSSCQILIEAAIYAARQLGMTISFDCNYRSMLWSFDEARDIISRYLPYVDVLIGIEPLHLQDENGHDLKDGMSMQPDYEEQDRIFQAMADRYHFKAIARHVRYTHSSSENSLKAYLYYNGQTYESKLFRFQILDRVGGGDAVSMTAKYTRQVRSAVLAELEQEYVAGARARGLSENRILFGNVLKSVLLRMVTLLFLSAGSLLGGTAIVETIFMWNGVGKMAVDAVSMHDIPVIQAYLVWMAAIYLLLHLIADLMMGALDPRAKLEGMR